MDSPKWTNEDVKERLANLFSENEEAAPERPYLEAAAVLSTFSPSTLNPVGGQGDKLEFLQRAIENPDLQMVSQTGSAQSTWKSPWNSPSSQWTITPEARRENLARLIDENRVGEALDANPNTPQDIVQSTLQDNLRGTAKEIHLQSLNELRATLQVATWLKGLRLPKEPPPASEIQKRVEWEIFLKPFRDLVQGTFAGRESEMDALSDYVGLYEATNLSEATVRVAERALNWQSRAPLFIQGPGGIGKSTLIAQFVITHAAAQYFQRFPIAYFDFDRPGLLVEEPITLLFDALRQIGSQFPEMKIQAAQLQRQWTSSVQQTASTQPAALNRANWFRVRDRNVFYDSFADFIQRIPNQVRALLFILDTFEEVQFRSRAFVEEVFDFLRELQQRLPMLRTVIAGRAPLKSVRYKFKPLVLNPFDLPAAQAFLQKQGIRDSVVAQTVAEQVGGSPLTLKLAARLIGISAEEVGPKGIRSLDTGLIASIVGDSIQGQLYNRILSHIHDPEVRKLAHPGLVLRRITPDVILHVLSEPCGLAVKDLNEARVLFGKLREEISLVDPGDDDALRHRSDVRAVMLQFLIRDDEKKVRQINDLAIRFYSRSTDPISRAEGLYHLLLFDFERTRVEAQADDAALKSVKRSIGELPHRSQAFVAARLNLELDDKIWKKADLPDWELKAFQQAEDYLALNKPKEALQVLNERTERTAGSSLYSVEIDALLASGDPKGASTKIDKLLSLALTSGPDALLLDACIRRSRVADDDALGTLRAKVNSNSALIGLLKEARQHFREPSYIAILSRWMQLISPVPQETVELGTSGKSVDEPNAASFSGTRPELSAGYPKLNCRFRLDRNGVPKSFRADRLDNYYIEIFVSDPPARSVRVTYYLDESYGDEGIFTKRNAEKNFQETIESYGDFELIALVEMEPEKQPLLLHRKISEALREWYTNPLTMTEPIRRAIENVTVN
jgi:cellulose synthase operon protein C